MKTALVTGAGRGLGKGFVDFLSQNGYTAYAGVRDLPLKTSGRAGGIYIRLDVQDDKSIGQAIEQIKREQGRIDLLINNAGVNKDTATSGRKELVSNLASLDRGALMKMFDVNAISPLMVIKVILPLMKKHGGFIINVSSNRASFEKALNDSRANYGYKASKAALNMFTKVLEFDLPGNVFSFAVHPGSVRTGMNPGAR